MFCTPTGACPSFVGTTPTRIDTVHMTVEYGQKVAPILAETLKGGGTI